MYRDLTLTNTKRDSYCQSKIKTLKSRIRLLFLESNLGNAVIKSFFSEYLEEKWIMKGEIKNLKIQTAELSKEKKKLQDDLNKLKATTRKLQDELRMTKKNRKENSKIQMNKITNLFYMSDAELKKHSAVDVYAFDEGNPKTVWGAVTAYCQLGGCDMGIINFESERDARLYSAILEIVGYQPTSSSACTSCYSEYMQGCI